MGAPLYGSSRILQQALRTFKETYNQQWLIERTRLPRTRRRPSRVCAHHGRVNTLTRLSKKSVAVPDYVISCQRVGCGTDCKAL